MKKERTNKLSCEKARSICTVQALAKLGHFPTRKSEKEAWFLSPFRSETEASFKVSLTLNRWYDHGAGIGGNVIDLVCLIKRCSVKEALLVLDNGALSFSFQQQPLSRKEPGIEVTEVKPIRHPALLAYLRSRKIKPTVARLYAEEVHFRLKGKHYFAIGLENISGGYELRNKFFKGSVSPKDITLLMNQCTNLVVCEGMFDLLTLASHCRNLSKGADILVLNSVAFVKKVPGYLKDYKHVELYLDRDGAGKKATQFLLTAHSKALDRSGMYEGYKDINEWWTKNTDG
ncbi:toprim domain-containing protein [Galbibacter mesophilus]|uniref:toprim domain-containing protein n=1 Tax=Galbibacter mesophilus TaxID=379069 RepID=UPI00191F3DD0|nr:toprim domain-containing protein [Galbibacter mesophilus]MCM5662520.1 toprim domain-containing protein [Galbibacter mesophilus]